MVWTTSWGNNDPTSAASSWLMVTISGLSGARLPPLLQVDVLSGKGGQNGVAEVGAKMTAAVAGP